MTLADKLKARIAATGPIGVDAFMAACLHDPEHGYYATRPRLGEAGDFITAPMVSQMFGELIGLWAAQTWIDLGRPPCVRLVEIGPGDGTLMADALRATRQVPGFFAAAEVWLVETSAPLAARQRERLGAEACCWTERLEDVPGDAPMLIFANEVLDCLPIVQFVRTAEGWSERLVGLDDIGDLAFGLGPPSARSDGAPPGTLIEVSPAQSAFAAAVARRIADSGGAALLIDYGGEPGCGATLQALRGHRKESPLVHPGEADLTAHVNFAAVLAAAKGEGVQARLLTQGVFLRRLGAAERAASLARAHPSKAEVIARQLARLTEAGQMGSLFKAACLFAEGRPPPPAFEEADERDPGP